MVSQNSPSPRPSPQEPSLGATGSGAGRCKAPLDASRHIASSFLLFSKCTCALLCVLASGRFFETFLRKRPKHPKYVDVLDRKEQQLACELKNFDTLFVLFIRTSIKIDGMISFRE